MFALAARAARADVITDWNTVALNAIRNAKTPPPVASRALAMTQLAMYDAVNAVDQGHQAYFYSASAAPDTSPEAAAAQSAYRVLSQLYPDQKGAFESALAGSLNALPDGAAKTQGVALGNSVGAGMIALRTNDGSVNTQPLFLGGTAMGQWRPTGPAYAAGLLPNWPNVTPFALDSGSQFRAPAPPALNSAEYATALNEVKTIGALNSATRTADQTAIALFWSDGGGTQTPPGHWNSIAQTVAQSQHNTLSQNARLFALLNMGLADAAISDWDTKYAYDLWRPVTAIQLADTDGNPDTTADPNWQPLIITPNFPSYSSGHSAFSMAGATILSDFYGTDSISFDIGADGISGTRHFDSFTDAAQEAGLSRIYGGIHFSFDNTASGTMGQEIGQYIYGSRLAAVPEPGVLGLLAGIVAMGGSVFLRRKRGRKQKRRRGDKRGGMFASKRVYMS